MAFVHTYDVHIGKSVWTMGLSTCIFVCIRTENAVIGWHFGAENMKGVNMNRISCLLHLQTNIKEVYLIPGVDRQNDLTLKQSSRTMRYRPDTDPAASRDWLFTYLASFSWSNQIKILAPPRHYKEIVIVSLDSILYKRNDAVFNAMCIEDAETMT